MLKKFAFLIWMATLVLSCPPVLGMGQQEMLEISIASVETSVEGDYLYITPVLQLSKKADEDMILNGFLKPSPFDGDFKDKYPSI